MKKMKDIFAQLKLRDILIYLFTIVFSVAFIVVGRHYAMIGYPDLGKTGNTSFTAEVTEIRSVTELENGQTLLFSAQLLSGDHKGDLVQVTQSIYTNYYPVQEPVAVGDKIIIYESGASEEAPWTMTDYARSDYIIWLGVIFCVVVLLFGRFKGWNTLVSLAFTCLSIFYVFLPSVLAGHNIYLWSIVVCLYIILMTMLFINGAGKKSLVAGLGCFSGVVVSGIITLIMNHLMKLTGMTSEDTLYLQLLDTAAPIDLKGIIFAAIIIGAVGAIMDVAMDISSSLNELKINVPDASAKLLIQSGLNIGRDILGTMANTLVLAYIGSSLSTTILFMAYNVSALELFNMELIIVELLQALAGSAGMLLCIPLTTVIAALTYTGHHKRSKPHKPAQTPTYTTTYTIDK